MVYFGLVLLILKYSKQDKFIVKEKVLGFILCHYMLTLSGSTTSILRAERTPVRPLGTATNIMGETQVSAALNCGTSPNGRFASKVAVSNSAATAANLFCFLVGFYLGL